MTMIQAGGAWSRLCDDGWWHAVAEVRPESPVVVRSACGLDFRAADLAPSPHRGDECCPSCEVLARLRDERAIDPPCPGADTVRSILHLPPDTGEGPE